jgi:hypothetical protein
MGTMIRIIQMSMGGTGMKVEGSLSPGDIPDTAELIHLSIFASANETIGNE